MVLIELYVRVFAPDFVELGKIKGFGIVGEDVLLEMGSPFLPAEQYVNFQFHACLLPSFLSWQWTNPMKNISKTLIKSFLKHLDPTWTVPDGHLSVGSWVNLEQKATLQFAAILFVTSS